MSRTTIHFALVILALACAGLNLFDWFRHGGWGLGLAAVFVMSAIIDLALWRKSGRKRADGS